MINPRQRACLLTAILIVVWSAPDAHAEPGAWEPLKKEDGIVTFDLAKREWRVLATRGRWPKLDSGGHAVLVLKRRLLVLGEGEAERPAGGEWLYWFDTQLQSWRRQAVPWTRGRSVRPPPTPRTNRTRHVPHPVPIGRAASPTPYQSDALRPC